MTHTPLNINGLNQLGADIIEKIYHEFVEDLLTNMESGAMKQAEIHEASSYILENISSAVNEEDVLLMIKQIDKRWPKLEQSSKKVNEYLAQSEDKNKLKSIQDQLIRFSSQ